MLNIKIIIILLKELIRLMIWNPCWISIHYRIIESVFNNQLEIKKKAWNQKRSSKSKATNNFNFKNFSTHRPYRLQVVYFTVNFIIIIKIGRDLKKLEVLNHIQHQNTKFRGSSNSMVLAQLEKVLGKSQKSKSPRIEKIETILKLWTDLRLGVPKVIKSIRKRFLDFMAKNHKKWVQRNSQKCKTPKIWKVNTKCRFTAPKKRRKPKISQYPLLMLPRTWTLIGQSLMTTLSLVP